MAAVIAMFTNIQSILYDSKNTSVSTLFIDQAKDSEKEHKQEEFQPDLFL